MPEDEVIDGKRVFGCRFIDELKKVGDRIRKKSRLVAHNYADEDTTSIATKAPTVQRFSQRVALCIGASLPRLKGFARDVTQAYIQSNTKLERVVYIKAPLELGLPKNYVLRVEKPLYGIPESGLHWYLTYLTHHLEVLHMTRSRVDPCVLYRTKNDKLEGMILLQVDDSLGMGNDEFLLEEERASNKFRCKERTPISSRPVEFNGITLMNNMGTYTMMQADKILKLRVPTNNAEYISQRALAQYVGVNVRPDVCAPVQLLVPGKEEVTTLQYKQLKKVLEYMMDTKNQGLNYVSLDMESARLVLLTDASFANAPGCKSQLGYVIIMVDKFDKCNILHYGSNRCQRVCRSVLAAEMHALILGFDFEYVIQDMVKELIGRKLDVEVMTDSKTLFNVVTKEAMTTERRLQIDILTIKQSYDEGEIRRMSWLPGMMNPADSLTKYIVSKLSPLFQLMRYNIFSVRSQGSAASHEKEVV